jgi:SAM-dependent methyltransferase
MRTDAAGTLFDQGHECRVELRMSCRICTSDVQTILDLGETPPANLLKTSITEDQATYPLLLEWCETCGNVQLRDCLDASDLYDNYLYVTPKSSMLGEHYEYLTSFLFSNSFLADDAFVLEIGSNAGYFLEHLQPKVRKVLGIDPAQEICAMANDNGIPTTCDFFNAESAQRLVSEHGSPSLIVGRHCMAHNESPHEMIAAAAAILDDGYLVIENAYVLNTIENAEFDQIYHEHMFYFSIRSMRALLELHGMQLVDVTMSLVHGGSVIFVAKRGNGEQPGETATRYEQREELLLNSESFARFAQRTSEIKESLKALINQLTDEGHVIYTYGATAKGNTLLNYVGLTNQQIRFCVDSTPIKQGRYLPQSNIEIISEEQAISDPPDYFLLTAWNYQDEIIKKTRAQGNYKSKFIVPIPFVQIV